MLFVALALALLALIAFKPHRRPVSAAPEDNVAEAAGLQPEPIHAIRSEDYIGGNRYLVRNLIAGPIEVDCRLDEATNVTSDPPLPRRLVLAALQERELTQLRSVDLSKSSAASMECGAVVGDPRAKPSDDFNYALPFYPGAEFTLDQGFDGAFSHHDAESRYSLDLGVAEGTPVRAARDGVVMQVEEGFRGKGLDIERYGDRANYVRVLHADGSMALYAHLQPRSTLFRPGDKVHAGVFLGKAGSTGFTTGPHLHFSVQANVGMALQSIPFNMAGVDPHKARLDN